MMSSSGDGIILYIIGAVLALALLFILLRELFCWYWKINQMVKNQAETIELLKELVKKNIEKPLES